jgi:signal transduction histidine kinase
MEDELARLERLASIGRFAAGIVHEIKNALGVLLGGVEYIAGELSGQSEQVRETLSVMKETGMRMGEMAEEVLRFSRPAPAILERVDPEELISATLSLMKYIGIHKKKGFSLETEFRIKGMQVQVDRKQIQQVIFNLLINGVDAMPRGGAIAVRLYAQPPSADFPQVGACVIEVSDTGEGIPRGSLSRLFDPFFSTKGDQGIGLGLVVCKMIVENHHGRLRIESEEGRGTRVRILLPRM